MGIKLIAMDMDGTLLEADHVHVSQRNVEALRAARARGVKIVLASGRTWNLLEGIVDQLGGVDYAIISNGAAVVDAATGEHLWKRYIPNAQALKVIDILHANGIIFEVYCGGKNYVRASEREGLRNNYLTPAFSDFFDAHTTWSETLAQGIGGQDIEKFNILYVPREIRARLEAEIAATGEPLEQANAFRDNMELSAQGVKKGTSLARLCESLGIAPEEVMAFGDGGNDVDMLEYAGWSFAMENGAASVKQIAKYLAPPNTDSGVGRMVEQYVLL